MIEALYRENLRLGARDAVLAALDTWARRCGLPRLPAGQEGATDGDLPHLFPTIDAHVDRLIDRSGLVLPDRPADPATVARERAEIARAAGRHSAR